ncbi:MAG: amino acid--[acyl-carrier-protein] ligase, partial [Solirubrobacteraceae bacterium]
VREASVDQAELLGALIDEGLLLESGVPGVYGHGSSFEEVRERLAARLSAEARDRGAEPLRFPPVLPRRQLESSGYLSSFPHLAGSIYAFEGDEQQAQTQGEQAGRHEDWSEHQRPTELTLMPAACYPVYPAIATRGPLPPGGVFVDAGGAWVFRHEPSHDPARRQIFHQHELVRIGEPAAVLEWRDEWAERGLRLLRSLGLDAELDIANDPFFGRRGRMLATNQRQERLKLELLVPIAGPEPTACASFNHHRDHFATTYGLTLSTGETAHTACLGFGHERIVLALLRTHGLDPAEWPPSVRAELWR